MSHFNLKDLIVGSQQFIEVVGVIRNREHGTMIVAAVIEHSTESISGDYTSFEIDNPREIVRIYHDYSKAHVGQSFRLVE